MKIKFSVDYEYEKNGITEENGYVKWYDWNVVKKQTTVACVVCMFFIVLISQLTKDVVSAWLNKSELIVMVIVCLIIYIVFISIIHELLHLLIPSKCKFGNDCDIVLGFKAFSALHKAHETRRTYIISLLTPVVTLSSFLMVGLIFSNGVIKFAFYLLLLMTLLGSYTDIYMVFYTLKNVKKDEVIFGLYKKSKNKLPHSIKIF